MRIRADVIGFCFQTGVRVTIVWNYTPLIEGRRYDGEKQIRSLA